MRLRRFDEEDKTIAAERALQKSRLETEWKRIEEDEKFRIRQMGALEEIPLVNSRGVMEAFNKKKTSKGVGNIHFKIYRPSEEQTKLIEEVYKNFGVDIYLPDHEMTLNKDIKEGVYQFSNINLVAHDDPIVRQYIEGILLNGIRVVDETN